jgi:hypothetical protein
MSLSPDEAFPFQAAPTNAPNISPAESEDRRAAAAAKMSAKDVEKRLGTSQAQMILAICVQRGLIWGIDSLERLLTRLHDQHSKTLEKRRKRRARQSQATAGVT